MVVLPGEVDDARKLFKGGYPGGDLLQAVDMQGRHPGLGGRLYYLLFAGVVGYQVLYSGVNGKDLEYARPAGVPAAGAVFAPGAAVELVLARPLYAGLSYLVGRWRVGLLAVLAALAHQPLGYYAVKGRGYHVLGYAHGLEPDDGAYCVVGVEGGEDQGAGQGRLVGYHRRVGVPHLAHEYDIGGRPEDRAQGIGECQPGLFVHGHLVDILQLVLYRVLYGDDVYRLSLYAGYHGVEHGGLAATGGAGHEHHALRPLYDVDNLVVVGLEKSHGVKVEHGGPGVEKPHDHRLPVLRRQGGDPYVEVPVAEPDLYPAVLGYAPLGDVHPGHDLYAGYYP